MEDIENIWNLGLKSVGLEEGQETQPQPSQRKRARGPSASQGVDDELAWVGGFFDLLLIVESKFNNYFDQVDFSLDHFNRRMDHMEYDIHQLYASYNLHYT